MRNMVKARLVFGWLEILSDKYGFRLLRQVQDKHGTITRIGMKAFEQKPTILEYD